MKQANRLTFNKQKINLTMQNFSHGGNIFDQARKKGIAPGKVLDFSANINPLGYPDWLPQVITSTLDRVIHYPEHNGHDLLTAACNHYQVDAEEIVFGNGSTEILYLLPRATSCTRAIIPVPSYVDYVKVCTQNNIQVQTYTLRAEDNFRLHLDEFTKAIRTPGLVFLGQPNNPTGQTTDSQAVRELAQSHPDSIFIIDEAFADFIPGQDRLYHNRPDNVLVLLSLTKFYAIPGLRLGLAIASPPLVSKLKDLAPPWSVNTLAQAVGCRALQDSSFRRDTLDRVQTLRQDMFNQLQLIEPIRLFPSKVNFFLCRLKGQMDVSALSAELWKQNILIRNCANYQGLDNTFFRIAVKDRASNEQLIRSLRKVLQAPGPSPTRTAASGQQTNLFFARKLHTPFKKPAIMFQGTSSNAGKSILAAGLCRILLQDGFKVAPFKAQNMSLNSFVTKDGGEMGRAQVLQAQACRLDPDVRMNPVLLKPSSETGSQVIVLGKPVGSMDIQSYIDFKQKLVSATCQAYDELAREHDIMVLEGAGSPAEINLKSHDLTNMNMAHYAQARVLLTGDIDRGGVFASFVGTLELLDPDEQKLLAGLIINKFRGDESLLKPAVDFTREKTGKPTLGIIPYLQDLGLPEEDSVSFKAGWDKLHGQTQAELLIGCIDLPHISNFTDLEPLLIEPDVQLQLISRAEELTPDLDLIILPGSKNVLSDLHFLQDKNLAKSIVQLARSRQCAILGICGGFQILGEKIADPLKVESTLQLASGLGLLPLVTELDRDKTLTQVQAVHLPSSLTLKGYEIHHGQTHILDGQDMNCMCAVKSQDGRELGFSTADGQIWGTYVHGLFDSDKFRRWLLDRLRINKGLSPLEKIQACFDLEDALDRLADVMREKMDLEHIYRMTFKKVISRPDTTCSSG